MGFHLDKSTKSFELSQYDSEIESEMAKIGKDGQNEINKNIEFNEIKKYLNKFNGQPVQNPENYKSMVKNLMDAANVLFSSKYSFFAKKYKNNTKNTLSKLNPLDIQAIIDAKKQYHKSKKKSSKLQKNYRALKASLKKIDQDLENGAEHYSQILLTLRKKVKPSVEMVAENICVITIYYILDLACGVTTSLVGKFVNIDDSEFGETRLLRGKSADALIKIKGNITKVEDLFPHKNPVIEDIKQGHVGDCYLLAALTSLIKTNPRAIKACFVSVSNGVIIIRLFKVEKKEKILKNCNRKVIYNPVKKILITLNSRTVLNGTNKSGAAWVCFIEKAYAKFREMGGNPYDAPQILSKNIKKFGNAAIGILNGGTGAAVMAAITGKPGSFIAQEIKSSQVSEAFSGNYNENAVILYNEIGAKLRSGAGVTVSFKPGVEKGLVTTTQKNSIIPEKRKGLVSGHAYSILGMTFDPKTYCIYVTLRNPWGTEASRGYTTYEYKRNNKDQATFIMELNDLINNMQRIHYI